MIIQYILLLFTVIVRLRHLLYKFFNMINLMPSVRFELLTRKERTSSIRCSLRIQVGELNFCRWKIVLNYVINYHYDINVLQIFRVRRLAFHKWLKSGRKVFTVCARSMISQSSICSDYMILTSHFNETLKKKRSYKKYFEKFIAIS